MTFGAPQGAWYFEVCGRTGSIRSPRAENSATAHCPGVRLTSGTLGARSVYMPPFVLGRSVIPRTRPCWQTAAETVTRRLHMVNQVTAVFGVKSRTLRRRTKRGLIIPSDGPFVLGYSAILPRKKELQWHRLCRRAAAEAARRQKQHLASRTNTDRRGRSACRRPIGHRRTASSARAPGDGGDGPASYPPSAFTGVIRCTSSARLSPSSPALIVETALWTPLAPDARCKA